MGPLSWIVLGLVAGWLAGMVTGRRSGRGCITTTVIGIFGAFVGGAVANVAGYDGRITDLSLRSVLIEGASPCHGSVSIVSAPGFFAR